MLIYLENKEIHFKFKKSIKFIYLDSNRKLLIHFNKELLLLWISIECR